MLLEIAIGDSYGAGFEFSPVEKVLKYNNIHEYQTHEKGEIGIGKYTDDTQMSLAIIELMLSKKKLNTENFAKYFFKGFNRDPRKGYASKFYDILMNAKNAEDMTSMLIPNSTRNGAMMRSVPLGRCASTKFIMDICRIQSSITHATEVAIRSSQVIALASHYLMRGAKLEDLEDLLKQHFNRLDIDYYHSGPVPCDAIVTVDAVMTALLRNRNMCSLLMDCVNFTGDVDSVAAVALGLASLSDEYDRRLPSSLLNSLENGKYGKDYLIAIDKQFMRSL
jgi:ADP-ribosyl-[dinitrogen reductase] hydrolase